MIHRIDLRGAPIKLLCTSREVQDRPKIVAANAIGIAKMSDIILPRHRMPFLNKLCEDISIIGEPVIIQTREQKGKTIEQHPGRRRKRRREGNVLDPQSVLDTLP